MTGYEVLKQMRQINRGERCFVKWWRKESDFVDYELVETFLGDLKPEHEFAGFELLTLEEMWQELHRREPHRVMLGKRRGETVIRWQHLGDDGSVHEDIYPFDAPSLMSVFEGETRGDVLS